MATKNYKRDTSNYQKKVENPTEIIINQDQKHREVKEYEIVTPKQERGEPTPLIIVNEDPSLEPPKTVFRPGTEKSQDQEHTEKKTEAHNIPAGYRLVRETKSERIQLLLTPTIKDKMRLAAKLKGLSMNEWCHQVFEEAVKEIE